MKLRCLVRILVALAVFVDGQTSSILAQTLDTELQQIPARDLAKQARELGDATRGAIVFFQPHMACSKCHVVGQAFSADNVLGPDLSKLDKTTTDESLIESVLRPSKDIRKGFETVSMVTTDGIILTGLLVERDQHKVIMRDVSQAGLHVTVEMKDVEQLKLGESSIMPGGQMNQLNSRQQFYDLVRYLIEIRDGGSLRAQQLQPSSSLIAFKVPEYENHLNHAGLIKNWDSDALKRGEAIYQRVCANCHGTKDQPGSLPTSLRFAEGKFKNGHDPLSMYRTLTHGFGLMAPQTWMVPSQKYDVIHYIRESYLKNHNPSQYSNVDSAYLKALPQGDTFGPEPSSIEAWSAMDYGPSLTHTFEIPGNKHNFAYKGIAIRLDPGAGGVSRGRHWMIFDTDTLRSAAGWNADDAKGDNSNFIDWRAIQFNGEHGVHPKIVGKTAFTNSTGPGWSDPSNGGFLDNQRVLGRDGKRYGPLPRPWGRFRGLYHHGQHVILSYSIGSTDILEMPRLQTRDEHSPYMLRTFNIGPRDRDLILQVAEHSASDASLSYTTEDQSVARLSSSEPEIETSAEKPIVFDGSTYLETENGQAFDMFAQDFTVVAKVKTKSDGTIWSISQGGPKWTPDGQTFFIRNGKLGFDIGWVGAVSAKTKIDDSQWHSVAAVWQHAEKKIRLFVDGKLDGEGVLSAKSKLPSSIARIGFTAPNFPASSFFTGEIAHVRFYQEQLIHGLPDHATQPAANPTLVAQWDLENATGDVVQDSTRNNLPVVVRGSKNSVQLYSQPVVAGFSPQNFAAKWIAQAGSLRLRIPAGQTPLRFTIWMPTDTGSQSSTQNPKDVQQGDSNHYPIADPALDLQNFIHGGPPRWPQPIVTESVNGANDGPFAVDILSAPESNPWLALTRFSGLDFFDDGRIAVCSWDGDVWIVTPSAASSDRTLHWQRIASGLFQPLGLKILKGKIHLICRDQLAILHDLNSDEEIDYYECLNNDHQVTEHFHEFAMGLQVDEAGNFYYAKSGCHGKAAVVPHHGTLLKVSPDGTRTEILANGFRAANGVCINPDGSFVVTDQEGFWNPKNRINWVTLSDSGSPKFYGNILGYHDVTDTSDAAMEQPLCWITNDFDRSPAELLWVEGNRWGPLKGSLLNLSYGYGKVFLVPHEKVGNQVQGGMIELPLPTFPTGVMRGRFSPLDSQLYLCGMFAWAGNATHPGGLYRLRATGQPVNLPTGLQATRSGLKLTFTEPIDPQSLDVKQVSVKTWTIKRTANYGSKHFDEKSLIVQELTISSDGKTITLDVVDLQPTWCMEINYTFRSKSGALVQGKLHNTIHQVGE